MRPHRYVSLFLLPRCARLSHSHSSRHSSMLSGKKATKGDIYPWNTSFPFTAKIGAIDASASPSSNVSTDGRVPSSALARGGLSHSKTLRCRPAPELRPFRRSVRSLNAATLLSAFLIRCLPKQSTLLPGNLPPGENFAKYLPRIQRFNI
jgi:hypothetical protein